MRILIAGVDGYLGWPLALRLGALGHELRGIDLGLRRDWVKRLGSCSAIPIASIYDRLKGFRERFGRAMEDHCINLTDYEEVLAVYEEFQPEAVVYLGEQPSAPYSMMSVEKATYTQANNVIGTLTTLYAIREACLMLTY